MKKILFTKSIRKHTWRLFIVIIIFIQFAIIHTQKSWAQSNSLKLSPSLIELKTVGPTTVRIPIRLENTSDQALNISVDFKEFKDSSAQIGQIDLINNNSSSFLGKIALIDINEPITKFEISPKNQKNLLLQIRLDADEEISDHYFSVIFTAMHDKSSQNELLTGFHSFTAIEYGVAMNVLLSIESKENPDTPATDIFEIEEFIASKFIDKGPVFFNLKLKNNSSKYIKSRGSIYIENMFGQLIGKIDLPNQIILANSSRYIGSHDRTSRSNISPTLPKILWPEKFLIGPYKATLKLEPNFDKPITHTIRFIAIPTKEIISILGILLLGIIIKHRASKLTKQ